MNESPALHNHINPWRIWIFGLLLLIVLGWYVVRLFTLQIVQGPAWSAQAVENRTREINLAAQRGVIYDRNGVVLARNIASYNVVITAANLPDDPGEVQEIFRQLSQMLNIPINQGEISETDPYVPAFQTACPDCRIRRSFHPVPAGARQMRYRSHHCNDHPGKSLILARRRG
jgi:penicillin-binding protein 2